MKELEFEDIQQVSGGLFPLIIGAIGGGIGIYSLGYELGRRIP